MPDLHFSFEKIEVEPFAVTPQLDFMLRLTNTTPDETIHTVALRAQVQLETTRRRYNSQEQESLRDLFGEPERWGQTLKTFLWTHTSTIVPAFSDTHSRQPAGTVHFRFQCRCHKVFCRPRRGRSPAVRAIQWHCVLRAERRPVAGHADSLGQGGPLPDAGEGLERPDGRLLSRHCLAVPGAQVRSNICTDTRWNVESRRGSRRWRACFARLKRK